MMKQSKENQPEKKDFYISSDGLITFTAHYHLKRGYCCSNFCKHCPYKIKKK